MGYGYDANRVRLMPRPSKKFKFGEWLPDQPDLDNPGVIEALNVLWSAGQYRPYSPLNATGAAVPKMPLAAIRVVANLLIPLPTEVVVAAKDATGVAKIYAGSGAGAASWTDVSNTITGYSTSNLFGFAQYGNNIFSCNPFSALEYRPAFGGATTFVPLAAPKFYNLAVVGQFLVGGNLIQSFGAPNQIQWSGIDDPFNWPVPNSAAAIAVQSGTQVLQQSQGAVQGIAGADQWAVVMQDAALTRMTYNGGATVFAFDTIYKGPGPVSQYAWIKVGPLVYFASRAGFFVCDGTNVVPLGEQKIDKYFRDTADFSFPLAFTCGVEWRKRVILWSFPIIGSSGVPAMVMAFSLDDKRFTHCNDTIATFVLGEENQVVSPGTEAFSATNKECGILNGTPGTAVLTSLEVEFNTGGKSLLQGVLPQISGTSPTVSVRIGSRNSQGDAVSFSGSQTPDAFTQSANFLIDQRYHRAEISIAGAFDKAIGGEFDVTPSSPL